MAYPAQNHLLNVLSDADLALLRPHLKRVSLNVHDTLVEPSKPISHVHFVESGLLSVIVDPAGPDQIEVGLIGRDGFSGLPIVLGSPDTPFRIFVQRPGLALRIETERFREALDASRTLERILLKYVHVFLIQAGESARANARFTVEERLARWLLMIHDRTDGDEITTTHEFLALMLGVRRPGVTVATHVLEGHGLIRATRGHIRVIDRAGLEEAARGSYGQTRIEFDRQYPGTAITPWNRGPEPSSP